jgi:hypothetical protein
MCKDGVCINAVCTAYAGEGEACGFDFKSRQCDFKQDFFCKGASGQNPGVCTKPKFANPGEPCGMIGDESVGCASGSCNTNGGSTGVCVGKIPYGGACTGGGAGGGVSQPSDCEDGLFCIAGKCDIEPFPVCN